MIWSLLLRWSGACLSCALALVIWPDLARAAGAAAPAVATWTQWRGPSGQGYTRDQRVPLAWSETQNLLWKTALPGQGNSSPIVWGDRVFLTAASRDGKERYVLCVHSHHGKLL